MACPLFFLSNGLVYAVGGYADALGQARLLILRRNINGSWVQLGEGLKGAAYKILDLGAGNVLVLGSSNQAFQIDSDGALSEEIVP
jgi:hypothetical protein